MTTKACPSPHGHRALDPCGRLEVPHSSLPRYTNSSRAVMVLCIVYSGSGPQGICSHRWNLQRFTNIRTVS